MINDQFRIRRSAAALRGEGFMSYPNAMLMRLRRALIAILTSSNPAEICNARSRILARVFEPEC